MIIYRMMNKYMSPETGGDQQGAGGDDKQTETPVAAKPQETPQEVPVEKPTEKPVETPTDTPVDVPADKETHVDEEPVSSKLAQVSGLVEQAGLTMKEVAEYAKANDGAVDLGMMVALKEKHGEAVAALIADQIKGIHTERMAEATKRDQEVFDQVQEAFKDETEQSGEETWKELAGWAKDNVSNDHRTEINKLLAQGGLAAKLAVQELVTAFKESQGSQQFQEADLLDADAAALPTGKDISKSEYNMELNRLLNSGHDYDTSREVAQLNARREKSIRKGIK